MSISSEPQSKENEKAFRLATVKVFQWMIDFSNICIFVTIAISQRIIMVSYTCFYTEEYLIFV